MAQLWHLRALSRLTVTAGRMARVTLLPRASHVSAVAACSTQPSTVAPVQDNYVKHWSAERVLSVGLLATLPVAFVCPWQPLEYLATLTVVVHSHWGVEAVVHDYIRPKLFGPLLPKLAVAFTYFLSAFMLGGLFYFNFADVGLVNAVKMVCDKV